VALARRELLGRGRLPRLALAVERVRIEYDPPDRAHEQVAPKALLALGWIASCLGWDAAEGGHDARRGGARFAPR
jgi:hypothetical protein